MVDQSPDLAKRITQSGGPGRVFNMAWLAKGSFFRPLSRSAGKSGSGLRPHIGLADELHEHPNRDAVEMIERGFKFRLQPLLLMITNSGTDRNSICYEEHEHAVRVAAGTATPGEDFAYVGEVIDDTTFSFVCSLDPGDDPLNDPSCWAKANLIAPGQTASSSIEYVQETGFTNNAGMVAEGTLKPESSLKLDLKNAPVRKIAHWFLASAEILADAPGLRSMIDNRLRYGLAFVEDVQLLKGDGTGQNLTGIKPQAADYAVPAGLTGFATPSMIDKLRIAQLQVALALYPADGQVLHPIDWAMIEMMKDGEGRYLIGNPQGTLAPTLWGLPVVPSMAQTVGEFTVGAWGMGAQLFDREQSGVLVSTEDGDNFRRNMVTVLAEERLALTVYRPEAFVDGTFANA